MLDHILEEHVKQAIPAEVYEREIGPMEWVLDAPGIARALTKARDGA